MKIKTIPFLLMLVVSFLALWSRLFYLQVMQGSLLKVKAEENRVKIEKLRAKRGSIYDRHGKVLAEDLQTGRSYLYGPELAHILGFIGEASSEEIKADDFYQAGDFIGKQGVEKQYDQLLRGQDGGILVETDAGGKVIRQIEKKDPVAGNDLVLSLDLSLQQQGFVSLQGQKGAVVATNPKTGEVLALVSSPSFDPNVFTLNTEENRQEKERQIREIFTSSSQPMFNRAIAGLYPPGSTFKILTALAALEEECINEETLVEDTGQIKVGEFSFGNWYYLQYGKTEGMVDLIKALKRSNDIFFYKTGEWLGINKLVDWAKFVGLGSPLGIDLEGEGCGLIPTPDWKKETKTERWYLGDTYITSIGQGNLQLTPLQVNHLTQIVAGNGNSCTPHVVKGSLPQCQNLQIDAYSLSLVKDGMKQACSEGGTGWPFFNFKPQVACKTGTAEFGSLENEKTHAWFTAFAPADDPEITITVLVEEAGEGSDKAAPIAKQMLEVWFAGK